MPRTIRVARALSQLTIRESSDGQRHRARVTGSHYADRLLVAKEQWKCSCRNRVPLLQGTSAARANRKTGLVWRLFDAGTHGGDDCLGDCAERDCFLSSCSIRGRCSNWRSATPQSGRWTQPNKAGETYRPGRTRRSDPARSRRSNIPSQWYLAPSDGSVDVETGRRRITGNGTPPTVPNALPLPSAIFNIIRSFRRRLHPTRQPQFTGSVLGRHPADPVHTYIIRRRPHAMDLRSGGISAVRRRVPPAVVASQLQRRNGWRNVDFTNVQPGWYVVEATWPDPGAGPTASRPRRSADQHAGELSIVGRPSNALKTGTADPTVALAPASGGDSWDSVNWQPDHDNLCKRAIR